MRTTDMLTMKKPLIGFFIALVLWTVMFSPWTSPYINFWVAMTCSGMILTVYSTWAAPGWWKDVRLDYVNIGLGVLLAAVLWGVFWLGELISTGIFDFARPQVDMIYGMKEGENPWILTGLMLFIIGPAEEIFWRGYLQKNFTERWNPDIAFVVTTLMYSLVHISKFNFMLIMAAMVAGIVWGLAYRFFPEKLGAIIISHALWDCAVFIWFPIM